MTAPALALSFREAARLLGIDRGSTLHALISAGALRTVPWGTGRRIPLEAVQQLARTGFTLDGRPSRAISRPRRKSRFAGGDVGAAIRALEVTP